MVYEGGCEYVADTLLGCFQGAGKNPKIKNRQLVHEIVVERFLLVLRVVSSLAIQFDSLEVCLSIQIFGASYGLLNLDCISRFSGHQADDSLGNNTFFLTCDFIYRLLVLFEH